MNSNTFKQVLEDHGFNHDDGTIEKTMKYLELLFQWNQKMNLTAIDTLETALDKHILDCLMATCGLTMEGHGADIGSGAGFPGMVWAIYFPNITMDLIEPTTKRCLFLNTVIESLGLTNVNVINKRSEDCMDKRESYDFVSARAVARLPLLLELCTPLLKVGGTMLALKGSVAMEEIHESSHAMDVLNISLVSTNTYTCEDGGNHITLVLTKHCSTPKGYPRNYSVMKKHPL